MKTKALKVINSLKEYWISHIWCTPVAVIVVFVVSATLLVMTYFKEEYIQYLKDETYSSERATLIAASRNLNFQLGDLIQKGSEFAVSGKILDMVEKYRSETENKTVNRMELNQVLSTYSRNSQWVMDISVVTKDELIHDYDKLNSTKGLLWQLHDQKMLFEMSGKVLEALGSNSIPRYTSGSHFITHPQNPEYELFCIAFPLKGPNGFGDTEYVLAISYNVDALRESLDFISEERKDIIHSYITDDAGNIVYHSNAKYIGMDAESFRKENKLLSMTEPIDRLNWNLNTAINEQALEAKINAIYRRGMIMFFAVFFILSVVIMLGIRWILVPVNSIRKSIRMVKKGNFNETIPVQGYHELWQMIEEYNKMIIAIRTMSEQVQDEHHAKLVSIQKQQEAEREALESQINSHFICNTLGVINYEVIESGNYKASMLIKKLSNILRYTFDQKNQEVYMLQEMMWIEQYLFLQKSRYEDMFDYEIEFPPAFEDWPCRKLMLQPFVENSILHGFEGRQQGGLIRITGTAEGERFKLTISDNGCGMDDDTRDIIRRILNKPSVLHNHSVGIGISNVVTRMKMYYGEQLEITMETEHGKGSSFMFLIPKKQEPRK